MSEIVTTAIPVWNGQDFILQTLESLTAQTRRPDRVVVLDNCSTDATPELVLRFKGIPLEYVRNAENLGLFGNLNRCLEFASETDYLHILHADDLVKPEFYEVMTPHLADCKGFGMAWCLDERIDERGEFLSLSGKPDGRIEVLDRDEFLRRKAEIENQAFAATLLKTNRRDVPCQFPTDMPILGDMVYWAQFGAYCEKVVHVHRPLAKYRWHGVNTTASEAPSINALVLDEWKTMRLNEALRGGPPTLMRRWKLRGLMAVRSGIKAKRFREQGNRGYSRRIVRAGREIAGVPLWLAGQLVVHVRDLVVYGIMGRRKHPKNVFG